MRGEWSSFASTQVFEFLSDAVGFCEHPLCHCKPCPMLPAGLPRRFSQSQGGENEELCPSRWGFGLFYCDSSMTAQQVALMEMNWSLPCGNELSKYFWMGLLRVFTNQEPSGSWLSRSHFLPDIR